MSACLKIASLNVNSLRKNLNSALSIYNDFDIVALVETKLDDTSENLFDMPNFYHYSMHRNRHGGGIRIYISNRITSNCIDRLSFISNTHESLFINLHIKQSLL